MLNYPLFSQNADTTNLGNLVKAAKTALKERNYEPAINNLSEGLTLLDGYNIPQRQIEILSLLADAYVGNKQHEEAAEVLLWEINILREQEMLLEMGQTYELRCFYLYRAEEFEAAIASGKEALKIVPLTNDSTTQLYALNEVAHCYLDLGRWDSCADYAYSGLELAEQMKDSIYMASNYSTLARVYKYQKEYEPSESFYFKARDIYAQKRDSMRLLGVLNEIGILYKNQKEFAKALDIYKNALDLAINIGQPEHQIPFYINLANVSIEMAHFENTKQYLTNIEELLPHLIRKEGEIEIGRIKAKLALHEKKYELALQHINSSYELAKSKDFLLKTSDILQVKSDILRQMGDYKEALSTFQLYTRYKDSLITIEKNKVIEELKARFETTEKERRLQEQQSEIELANLKFRISVLTGFFVILFILGLAYAWKRRNELKRKALANKQAFLIEKNKSLEEVSHLKSRFFNNISHELRTPLSLISTPIVHMLETLSTMSKSEMKNTLEVVNQNANKLLLIVEEILELSRVEAGKAELFEKPLAVKAFCKQIFSLHDSKAVRKEINYHFISEVDNETTLLVDRKKLEKIINNLLSNALKYTEIGGEVNLYLDMMPREKGGEKGNILLLKVEDTGRGIPKEDIPYVFDRYFQSKSREMPVEGGTGIGLSFAKELAQLMGGTLVVESEWGNGSTFIVSIPVQKTDKKDKHTVLEIESDGERQSQEAMPTTQAAPLFVSPVQKNGNDKPKLLIVEDNIDIQWMIKDLLKNEYDCVIANQGVEALKLLEDEKNKPSLILSDIMMPQMDGYALLENLKSHEEWQKIPVVMLTARGEEEDKLQALRMGVDDYLTKPFSPAELRARIQNLLFNYGRRKEFIEEEKPAIDISFEKVEGANQQWLQQLEDAAKEGLGKKIDVSASYLADHMALSERQLRRRIKLLTGLNSKQYIQEVKLQKARHLFENQACRTIAEVAYACGFNTPAYFSKLYFKHFGKKPSAYFTES